MNATLKAGSAGIPARRSVLQARLKVEAPTLKVECRRFTVFALSRSWRAGMPALPGRSRARVDAAVGGEFIDDGPVARLRDGLALRPGRFEPQALRRLYLRQRFRRSLAEGRTHREVGNVRDVPPSSA